MSEKTLFGLPLWISILLPLIWLVVNTLVHYLRERSISWVQFGRDLHLASFSMSLAMYLLPESQTHNPGILGLINLYLFLNLVFLSVTSAAYMKERGDWCMFIGTAFFISAIILVQQYVIFSI